MSSSKARRRKQLRAKIACKRADRTNNRYERDRMAEEAAFAMGPEDSGLMSTLRTLCDIRSGTGSPQDKQRRVEDIVKSMPVHMQRQMQEIAAGGTGGFRGMLESLIAGGAAAHASPLPPTKTAEEKRRERNREKNRKRNARRRRKKRHDEGEPPEDEPDGEEPPLPENGIVVQTGDVMQDMSRMLGDN